VLSAKRLICVFCLAMLVRGVLFTQTIDRPQVLLQPDSGMYLELAQGMLKTGTMVRMGSSERPSVDRPPAYPFWLSLVFSVFGESLLLAAMIQIVFDSLSCVFICYLGDLLRRGCGFASGIIGAINMNMLVYSHFILSDSLFLFVFLVFLVGVYRFFENPTWRCAGFLGVALGVSTLFRSVAAYLIGIWIPFVFLFMLVKKRGNAVKAASMGLVVGVFFSLSLGPWLMRNYLHYGRLGFTAQAGEHLLQYVVPFVWQYSKGIPFIEGMKKANDEFLERASQAGLNLEKATPFEISDFQVDMATGYLKSEPKDAILKAWMYGAAKNLFAPAIVDLSYLLKIERPHFFYTEGTTTLERAWNFLRGMRGWFGWAVVASLVVLAASRILQVWGVIRLMRGKAWECLFLLLVIGYFLLVSGPVGYAKYRLPFEPILIIFLAIGIKDLYERWIKRDRGQGSGV